MTGPEIANVVLLAVIGAGLIAVVVFGRKMLQAFGHGQNVAPVRDESALTPKE